MFPAERIRTLHCRRMNQQKFQSSYGAGTRHHELLWFTAHSNSSYILIMRSSTLSSVMMHSSPKDYSHPHPRGQRSDSLIPVMRNNPWVSTARHTSNPRARISLMLVKKFQALAASSRLGRLPPRSSKKSCHVMSAYAWIDASLHTKRPTQSEEASRYAVESVSMHYAVI